jgi:hypothetical protein
MLNLKTKKIIIYIILTIAILSCAEKQQKLETNKNMETKIVNISTEECDEYIGRGTKYRTHMLAEGIKCGEKGWLGNPHPIGWCDICLEYHNRVECIEKFKIDFYQKIETNKEFKNSVAMLKGKRLGCYCKPDECHGDIIKEWIDSVNI